MITINLLPPHMRPIKRSPLPYLLSMLVFLVVVAGCVLVETRNQAHLYRLKSQHQQYQRELEDLRPIVEEFNALNKSKETLGHKIQAISEIVGDRIIWSKHLARLADMLPRNLWYSSVVVEEKPFTEVVRTRDPQTNELKENRVVVRRPVLLVKGYAIEDEEGSRSVNPLVFATQRDPEFSEVFGFLSPAIEDRLFDGHQVRAFTLEYLIKPGGTAQ